MPTTLTAGIGPWFLVGGIVVVISGDQIGWFTVSSVGPLLGGDQISGAHFMAADNTFVTPQIGFSESIGVLFSEQLEFDVSSYEGTSLIGGASLGSLTVEYSTSVNDQTGYVDNAITGYSIGYSASPIPVEGHYYYTNSVYNETVSRWLTAIWQVIN